MQARLKQLGVTAFHRVGPYLIAGGVATNLYILTAPQQVLATRTCENALGQLDDQASFLAILNAVLVADLGLYVFNVAGAMRAIVIPTTHWAYKQVAELLPRLPTLSKYQAKSLEISENEVTQAISTGMFVSMLPLSRAVTMPLLPVSLLPLGRIFLKHRLRDYPGSATYQQYHEIYSDRPWLANTLSAAESISTGVNLGGALNALSYFLINAFYDSSHENDWPYQNTVMTGMTVFGMMAGMASIFNERTHRMGNHVSSTIEMFYLICMPLVSMTLCFAPSLEDMDTFMQEGIYVVLGIAAFSLLMAEIDTRLKDEREAEASAKVEEVESDDEDYIVIPSDESQRVYAGYGTLYAANRSGAVNHDAVSEEAASPSPRGDV